MAGSSNLRPAALATYSLTARTLTAIEQEYDASVFSVSVWTCQEKDSSNFDEASRENLPSTQGQIHVIRIVTNARKVSLPDRKTVVRRSKGTQSNVETTLKEFLIAGTVERATINFADFTNFYATTTNLERKKARSTVAPVSPSCISADQNNTVHTTSSAIPSNQAISCQSDRVYIATEASSLQIDLLFVTNKYTTPCCTSETLSGSVREDVLDGVQRFCVARKNKEKYVKARVMQLSPNPNDGKSKNDVSIASTNITQRRSNCVASCQSHLLFHYDSETIVSSCSPQMCYERGKRLPLSLKSSQIIGNDKHNKGIFERDSLKRQRPPTTGSSGNEARSSNNKGRPILSTLMERYGVKERNKKRSSRLLNESVLTEKSQIPSCPLPSPMTDFIGLDLLQLNSLSKQDLVPCALTRSDLHDARIVAQVHKKFLVAVTKRRTTTSLGHDNNGHDSRGDPILVFVDQHAADERILLEELHSAAFGSFNASATISQSGQSFPRFPVSLPIEFKVSPSEAMLMNLYQSHITYWGWEWEWDCKNDNEVSTTGCNSSTSNDCKIHLNSYNVRMTHIPELLGMKVIGRQPLIDYLSELSSINTGAGTEIPRKLRPPKAFLSLLISKSCRSAIMFGDILEKNEMAEMLRSLAKTIIPFACAHGRPTACPSVCFSALHETIERMRSNNYNIKKCVSDPLHIKRMRKIVMDVLSGT